MKNHLSKLSLMLIGFIGGVAFLISCGDGGDSAIASVVGQDYYVVDAANVKVGRLISILDKTNYVVINSKGYIVHVDTFGTLLRVHTNVFYASTDCTGQVYATAEFPIGSIIGSGFDRYSIPPDANVVTGFSVNSVRILGDPACTTISVTETAVPAYINDLSVTGVPTTGYLGTLRVRLL